MTRSHSRPLLVVAAVAAVVVAELRAAQHHQLQEHLPLRERPQLQEHPKLGVVAEARARAVAVVAAAVVAADSRHIRVR